MQNRLIAIVFTAVMTFAAITAFAATYKSKDGSIAISGRVIEFASSSRLVVNENVKVKAVDPKAHTMLEVFCNKVTIDLYQKTGQNADESLGSIKEADFFGPLKIVYTTKDESGQNAVSTATSKSGRIDGAKQLLYLEGGVTITHTNPAEFESPVVATGDTATVNLAQNIGEDDFRFRIESSPGVSKIEVTPRKEGPEKE